MDLSHFLENKGAEALKILATFPTMWNGNPGEIEDINYRITLCESSKPFRSECYRAGTPAKQTEQVRVVDMLKSDVFVWNQSEWASCFVLKTEPDDSLGF